ncbi:MAG: phosphatase PAP2 family protein [Gammaproteobacteria bacterium]|jgi:membrane-associated PAP2 superfamily phosphatase|nr:phosphatase PAP2 family protein [Gammaproteobacteria bacterium]
MGEPGFWRRHALWPGVLFLLMATASATTGLDQAMAHAWAVDPLTHRFIGSGAGEWWAKGLIHSWGGALVRIVGVGVVLGWLASFRVPSLRRWRRPAGFLVASVALGLALVGVLKQVTNIDCPRSLAEFGGDRPYVHLFADRPDSLPRAQCFPGGHSSSGFAFFAGYFLMLGRSRALARRALGLALLIGGVFAFGQEARGAHFLSHDLWSAALVWFSCLAVYAVGYQGNVWENGDRPNLATPN